MGGETKAAWFVVYARTKSTEAVNATEAAATLRVLYVNASGQVCKSDIYSGLYVRQARRSCRLYFHCAADPAGDIDVLRLGLLDPLVVLYRATGKYRESLS